MRFQLGAVVDLYQDIEGDIADGTKAWNAGFEFFPTNKVSINASFSRYQNTKGSYRQGYWQRKASTFNLNSRYYLMKKRISPYALLGLSYNLDKVEYTDVPSYTGRRTNGVYNYDRLAIDVGLGSTIKIIDEISLFVQAKYSRSTKFNEIPSDILISSAGITFKLK